MATNDVPGAVAENKDVLARGCWAEHEDGSLIYVSDVFETAYGAGVIFSLFDTHDRDQGSTAMPMKVGMGRMNLAKFEEEFTWNTKKHERDKWLWHDKRPFPWNSVQTAHVFPGKLRAPELNEVESAARRVAKDLGLRLEELARIAPPIALQTGREMWKTLTGRLPD